MVTRHLTEKIGGVVVKEGNLGHDLREGSLCLKQFATDAPHPFSIIGANTMPKASVEAPHLLGKCIGRHRLTLSISRTENRARRARTCRVQPPLASSKPIAVRLSRTVAICHSSRAHNPPIVRVT